MKIETGETAAIQALRDCLEEIPFIKLMHVSADDNILGADIRMEVRIQNQPLTILAEYKTSGQPRLAREAAFQIKDRLAKSLGVYGIFMAPYISPEAAVVCKKAGIGYLDLAGNCLLSFDTVYIFREGKPNSDIQRRELRSLYSPKAERILRVLLNRPQQNWKTGTLAEAAQVSFGQVANVIEIAGRPRMACPQWSRYPAQQPGRSARRMGGAIPLPSQRGGGLLFSG